MSKEKVIVLTAYGHGGTVDKISVNSFDEPEGGRSPARAYIQSMQNLKLKDDHWVTANIISEFSEYLLKDLVPSDFDVLLSLDDRGIQKVLREVDSPELTKALKGCDTEIQDKIFRNMSKRAGAMLKEDMEYIGPVRLVDVMEARENILSIIRRLEREGEIVVPRLGEDRLVL